jgi:hypothetical protein
MKFQAVAYSLIRWLHDDFDPHAANELQYLEHGKETDCKGRVQFFRMHLQMFPTQQLSSNHGERPPNPKYVVTTPFGLLDNRVPVSCL